MAISEAKMKTVIDNYFKAECDVNTSIRESFEKGFRIGVMKGKAVPEVDAVPVVHGKWEWLSSTCDRNPCEMRYRCSKCYHETITHDHSPWENYCPNCGARMNLEEQNEG